MAWQREAWKPDRSIGEMLQDIVGNVQEIIRSEVRLAKTEMREEAKKLIAAAGMTIAGAVFGLYAIGFLLLTCVYALSLAVSPWLAALIVGVCVSIIAGVLVAIGMEQFRKVNPKPERTIETMRENVQWAKDQTK